MNSLLKESLGKILYNTYVVNQDMELFNNIDSSIKELAFFSFSSFEVNLFNENILNNLFLKLETKYPFLFNFLFVFLNNVCISENEKYSKNPLAEIKSKYSSSSSKYLLISIYINFFFKLSLYFFFANNIILLEKSIPTLFLVNFEDELINSPEPHPKSKCFLI